MQKPRQAAFFRPSFSEFDYFDEDALRRMHVKVTTLAVGLFLPRMDQRIYTV